MPWETVLETHLHCVLPTHIHVAVRYNEDPEVFLLLGLQGLWLHQQQEQRQQQERPHGRVCAGPEALESREMAAHWSGSCPGDRQGGAQGNAVPRGGHTRPVLTPLRPFTIPNFLPSLT